MKLNLLALVLVLVNLTFATDVFASPIAVDQTNAKTTFLAVGKPAMIKIRGEEQGIDSKLDSTNQVVSGEIKVALDKFKTGIDTRDEHMKNKYLETPKYPDAVLKLKDVKLPDLKANSKTDMTFKAELTLHGVTKEVDVKANLEAAGANQYKVVASSNINLSDFKIDIPTYMGIKVADNVTFEVSFTTK